MTNQTFHQVHDGVLIEEGSLDVELRKIRLSIGAQIFVAKTAHDLVVAFKARNHQQLLENLWRLRQREELARVRARRHQIIARTLGRGLGQHRRFDIDKTRVIQIVPHRTCQLMPLAQALIHDIAAQIEVAVFQAHFFRDVFVELERQGLGAVQRFDFAS